MEKINRKTLDLVGQGVILSEYQNPTYMFTKLNDIKPEMIAAATANAREAAEQFARDSKSKLGKIRHASQGMFTIASRDAVLSWDEGQQIEKKVRVVSTIEYFLSR
jgi:hypothetical protein